MNVRQWAAGVAEVDGSVRLDEILIHRSTTSDTQICPTLGADNANRQSPIQSKRATHRNRPVTNTANVTIAQLSDTVILHRTDVDNCKIGFRISTDHLTGTLFASRQRYDDRIRTVNHVMIGQNITARVHNHTRSTALGENPTVELVVHPTPFDQNIHHRRFQTLRHRNERTLKFPDYRQWITVNAAANIKIIFYVTRRLRCSFTLHTICEGFLIGERIVPGRTIGRCLRIRGLFERISCRVHNETVKQNPTATE
ncbi:hypothetical protein BMS3Bbin04_01105 [bacterium BMS3Bbin04]|nr:hypothetical protein BMS3Bbin04_01105 [bacterium BMS3Bbin04]